MNARITVIGRIRLLSVCTSFPQTSCTGVMTQAYLVPSMSASYALKEGVTIDPERVWRIGGFLLVDFHMQPPGKMGNLFTARVSCSLLNEVVAEARYRK